jgi:hypothetical protein
MIISMRLHATREEIDHVCERIQEFGYKVVWSEYSTYRFSARPRMM